MGGKAKKDRDVSKENADSSGELRVVILLTQGELLCREAAYHSLSEEICGISMFWDSTGILRDLLVINLMNNNEEQNPIVTR